MAKRPVERKTEAGTDRLAGKRTVVPAPDRDQLTLFTDPVPAWTAPCKPTLVIKPPSGDNWLHEIKWDGYRISIAIEEGRARVYTSKGHDWTKRFPAIAEAAAALPVRNAYLDGEAVVLDEDGRSRFGLLQKALTSGGAFEAIVYVFDLLFFDGLDIRSWPLENRRLVLEGIIAGAGHAIRFSEALDAPGNKVFEVACQHELEGTVSKRRDRPYLSGQSKDWLKAKCIRQEEFVIIGYQPGARGGFGALHVASEEGYLLYRGSVGTGFSDRVAQELKTALDSIRVRKPPVLGLRIKGAVWCQPLLRAQVAYRDMTSDGLLRHASYLGRT